MNINITEDTKVRHGSVNGRPYTAFVNYHKGRREWDVELLVHLRSGTIFGGISRSWDAVTTHPYAVDAVAGTIREWKADQ